MDVYVTEQEQIEQLKKWWHLYGKPVLLTLLVVLVLVFSWRTWKNHQDQIAIKASVAYEQLFSAYSNHDEKTLVTTAHQLMTETPKLPYASDAALLLAKINVEQHQLPEAVQNLQWILKNSPNATTRQVARLRLARLFIAQNQPQAALDLLQTVDQSAYIGVIDFVRGDALLALGKTDQAHEQYHLALEVLPQDSMISNVVKMKFEN